MSTTLTFKDVAGAPVWGHQSQVLAATAAGACVCNDMRNDNTRSPYMFYLRSATAFDCFNTLTNSWMPLASPALAGTFGAGAMILFHPSQGPRGTLAAGSTTAAINITTAMPNGASVGTNTLANNGRGVGYKIRIIGSGTASSGKIEERTIVGNTSGTTPTIYLDSALSFSPTATDKYEILSGRVYLLNAGTLASNIFKNYDLATNSYNSVALSTTNLPATIGTDSTGVALSELHVPNERAQGSGLLNGGSTYNSGGGGVAIECILASAITNTTNATVTGSGMPASLLASEYRNHQIRIVEDTTNTTAVGQRLKINTHTAGAAGVFTMVGVFTVAPSATCKFVVENDDDKIIIRSSATTSFYTHNITANTVDTSTFTAGGTASGAGNMAVHSFGITRDTNSNATGPRHSHVHFLRGAAASTVDVLDIAGGTNGSVSATITYWGLSQTFTTGTSGAYDPVTLGGKYFYININGTTRFCRYDVRNRRMEPSTDAYFPQGAALVGGKMACATLMDGATKLNFMYHVMHTQTQMIRCVTAV